jgi:hypothetical protein
MNAQNVLREFTAHVRKTKGSGEALRFYVDYIQPIKEYFGGDEEVGKLDLPLVSNRACYFCGKDAVKGKHYCSTCAALRPV